MNRYESFTINITPNISKTILKYVLICSTLTSTDSLAWITFYSNIPKLRYQKSSLVTDSDICREELSPVFGGDSNKKKYPMKEKSFLILQSFT